MAEKVQLQVKPEFIVNLRGKDFVLYAGLLDLAHQKGIRRLETELVQLPDEANGGECVIKATLELKDGEVYTDYGDANPSNVNRPIAAHIIRMASTRAKARVLRDATNIGLTALEELGSLDEEGREPTVAMGEPDSGRLFDGPGAAPGGASGEPQAGERQAPGGGRRAPLASASHGSAGAPERDRPTPAPAGAGASAEAGGSRAAAAPDRPGAPHGVPTGSRGIKVTDAQLRAIRSIARSKGMTPRAIEDFARRHFNTPLESLNIDEASHIIKELQRI